jgi:hypothetical protein
VSWSQCRGGGKRRTSGSKGRAALTSVECVYIYLQELEKGGVVHLLPACRQSFHGCIDARLPRAPGDGARASGRGCPVAAAAAPAAFVRRVSRAATVAVTGTCVHFRCRLRCWNRLLIISLSP